jgi:hypothetical protein
MVAWILGIGLLANGLTMLAVPAVWYAWVPGISETGAFNPHFIRDIGAAYLMVGTALPWFAVYEAAWPAAWAGCRLNLFDATQALNLCARVSNSKIFRGQMLLIAAASSLRSLISASWRRSVMWILPVTSLGPIS